MRSIRTWFSNAPGQGAVKQYAERIAAAEALAGVGFEKTRIEFVADPKAGGNRNEILAEGPFGSLELRMLGKTRPEAPRTSISAPLSIVRAVLNRGSGLVV